jgi:class 3 adenylate cyclase/predicted ATPase
MDISAWLRDLGLERYEGAFRANEINPRVLPRLTSSDLKELGVTPLGHRRLILDAIAALKAPGGAVTTAQTATSRPSTQRPEAERRQLTVLFCDLVGSTELSARLDPEDMGELIRRYQERCAEVVARWNGHVAKYMGDGVLAYFGWPQAHEDDAERAVRAGLDLAQGVGRLTTMDGAPLGARVGIATGLVMVGDLVGEGIAQEQRVVGETPNLAARLQSLAEPGTVVIAAGTRQLLGRLFDHVDLGTQILKGFAAPVLAWRVLGESRAESRFEALHGEHLTAMVGREHEIGLLAERWERAKEGEGQVVLLSGEPGIGKSRIMRALRERLAGEPHMPLSFYCSPHHTNSALYPVIGLLERAAGYSRDDEPDARIAKLEGLLALATDALDEAVPLVAALLGVETGDRYPPLALDPQRRKQRTLQILIDQVEGLAARQPVLAVYEDVHWVDPTTLEAMGLLIERVQRLPVLVLITFRPEFRPPWTGHAHVMQLSLSRLTRRHGQALIAEVTGGKALPDAVLEQIVAKTDGVPLFVEELTKTVLESGLLRDAGDRFLLDGSLPELAIPTTLHDSLTARLDRLAPVKEIAQIGAAIGRTFSRTLMAAVAGRTEADLDAALDKLIDADLIFRRGTAPETNYSFKHALVRDAAYEGLLRSRRQQLHTRIAQVLEERFPETVATQPELLAHHLTEAGHLQTAIGYWKAAAQCASERSAHREAVAHLCKSLELLRDLPASEERDRLELEAQITLGSGSVVIDGYAADSVRKAYARARRLAQKLDLDAPLFTATWGLWMVNQTGMQVKDGRALVDELLAVTENGDDLGRRLQAHHAAWTTLLFVPELAACHQHVERGLALYDSARHVGHKFQYGGHDPGVCGLKHLGVTEWLIGFPDRALDRVSEAMRLARDLGHGPSMSIAMVLASQLHRMRGETGAFKHRCEEHLSLCVGQGIYPQHAAFARIGVGWAIAQTGDLETGLAKMREGLSQLDATGVQISRAFYLALFGEACIGAGRFEEGRHALAEALESPERWWAPEMHRLRGELALAEAAGAHHEGEHDFEHALALARSHESRSLELRAATSLARLWAQQGERQKAHDLLAPVYGWFKEGFDTADLKDAKALLDELA